MSEDKGNGKSNIAKNNEEEYPYVSLSRPFCYRKHKARCCRYSALFVDGDTPNAIITFTLWQEHGLIIVDPDRPRHFRLDIINQEQLLALNYT